jgi:mannose-1-phosphate guanylyltransferase/mannose-6-phosphate isomerase
MAEHWSPGAWHRAGGDWRKRVNENQSVYVPSGAKHRLDNPGKIDFELIEVQTGRYLGKDDIERVEDDYHRS